MTDIKRKKLTSRKNAKSKEPKMITVQEVQENGEVVEIQKPLGKRTPRHEQKAIGIIQEPGWTYRQVVMKPGRVEGFKAADWQIVENKDNMDTDGRLQVATGLGRACTQVVNFHNLSPGEASSAVWMRIKTELYEQDQRDKLKLVQEQEDLIDPRNAHKENPDVYYTSTFKKENDF